MDYVIPDTNIIIEDPAVIKHIIEESYTVIIPLTVIDELDKLKSKPR